MSAIDVDLEALLAAHALGALAADDARAVERAIADGSTRARLDQYLEAAAALAIALPSVTPPPAVRRRIDDGLDALVRPGRLEAFSASVAALFDVTLDKARMFVGWVDDPSRWQTSPLPHVHLVHLPPGPAWAAADCGLVRLPAGTAFPWHTHDGGDEVTLVLQGRARYTGGREVGPGGGGGAAPPSLPHPTRLTRVS
jgi:hypothetical protein